jgi:PAS domain S-box-containing protein
MSDALTAALMAQLYDVTTAGIVVVDADQRIVRVNRGAEVIFGYQEHELENKPLDMLIPARMAGIHRRHVDGFNTSSERARMMGVHRDIIGLRKDGSEFPATAGIAKLEHDGRRLFAVFLNDTTEQTRAQEEARAQQEEMMLVRERNRLARDLHDAVSQTLYSASLIADVLPKLWERDPQAGRQRLGDLGNLNRSALAEMRMLLIELRPSALIEANLSDLLKQLVLVAASRSGIQFVLEIDPALTGIKFAAERQVALYRIAQEAINNLIKHSRADHARVTLTPCSAANTPGCIELAVYDDGRGIPSPDGAHDHHGLNIIRERAREIGASLTIDSAAGTGTRVVIRSEMAHAKSS